MLEASRFADTTYMVKVVQHRLLGPTHPIITQCFIFFFSPSLVAMVTVKSCFMFLKSFPYNLCCIAGKTVLLTDSTHMVEDCCCDGDEFDGAFQINDWT